MFGFLRPILRPGGMTSWYSLYIYLYVWQRNTYILYTAIGMDSASLPVGNGRVEDLLC